MPRAGTHSGAATAWRFREATLHFDRPIIMGILNVTPDSFSDGGRFADPKTCEEHLHHMVQEGAHIIDVGGESTRPGSVTLDVEEEWSRVAQAIEQALATGVLVSIDTSKAEVARRALAQGVHIVNDITAMSDPHMAGVVREFKAGIVLMHMKGTPLTMQRDPHYHNVVHEITGFLEERKQAALDAGIPHHAVALDPGIGFGKTLEHNLDLLTHLHALVTLGNPVVLGASRKRFIGDLTGVAKADGRVYGSISAAIQGLRQGVHIFRVHDVGATHQALTVADALDGR